MRTILLQYVLVDTRLLSLGLPWHQGKPPCSAALCKTRLSEAFILILTALSGMSSIGGAACSTYCVSASLSSDSPFPSIYLQKVRDAIQIRWQSSDLSVLETHPLTLGLTLNPPAPTLPPLAQLEPAYKIAIGLAFLPF